MWHLAFDPSVLLDDVPLSELAREAVFITNEARVVPTWRQRAGDPVWWDYHVILCAHAPSGWRALDLDSTLGWAIPAADWIEGSFQRAPAPPELAPRFRVVGSASLAATFSSDRSHMRDAAGNATRPFPDWPPIQCALGPMTLPRFLDLQDPIAGEWLDLAGLRSRYASRP